MNATHYCILNLKVHKIENFFDSDFGICVISLLVVTKFFDWTILGGATIIPRSPRTTRNEKSFKIGKFFFFFKSYMTLKYLLIIDFPKFEPLTAAEMALCGKLGPKC